METSRAGGHLGDHVQASWGQCGTTELVQASSPCLPFWVHQEQGRIWGQKGALVAMGPWGQHSNMGWRAGSSPASPTLRVHKSHLGCLGDRRSHGRREGAWGWTWAGCDPCPHCPQIVVTVWKRDTEPPELREGGGYLSLLQTRAPAHVFRQEQGTFKAQGRRVPASPVPLRVPTSRVP